VKQELPKIVSVDDHVVEPAHVWQTWLPEKHRAQGPRIERRHTSGHQHVGGGAFKEVWSDEGTPVDCWIYEDRLTMVHRRMFAAVGFDLDDREPLPMTYDEMRPGCYEPKARLDDMDVNWVEASLCFPTFPRFCGQTFLEGKDRDLGLACVRAYNDWMVEEWCGDSGGRLVPLILIPLWDAELAAAEIRRNAARGVHAVTFCEIPPNLGLPSIHSGEWDRFFAACDETDTVINMHVGSSSKMPATGPDAPPAVALTLTFGNAMSSLTDWLFSGKLAQFPNLRIAYSEGQIGWLPYVLERADDVWEQHRAWAGVADAVPDPPSSYYHRSVFGCFFRDEHGIRSLDEVGVDNITFETDYPHTDSTWPDTKAICSGLLADVDDAAVRKIVRGNAIRMLHLDLEP
jgi:predicted TIM-barrel fold metal-dependent hydrolase